MHKPGFLPFTIAGVITILLLLPFLPQAYAQTATAKASETLPPLPGDDEIKENAEDYKSALQQIMSLSPGEIVTLHKEMDSRQRAAAQPAKPMPKPRNQALDIALRSGDGNPSLPLLLNYATSVSIFDVTGKPWPIMSVVNGDPTDFEIKPPLKDSHHIYVKPKSPYARGNMILYLKDYSMPLVVDLEAGADSLSSSVKIRLASRGPGAQISLIENETPKVGDPILTGFLQGVPPASAEALAVDGIEAQAWRFKNHIYLRSRATMLSPGCSSQSNDDDANNMHVCEMEDISVALVSENGRQVPIKINAVAN